MKTHNHLYIKILLILPLALLIGCAGQGLKMEVSTSGPGGVTKSVQLETDYQIENGLTVDKDGVTGGYKVELGTATTKGTDAGVYAIISQMMEMMRQMYGIPVPVQQ